MKIIRAASNSEIMVVGSISSSTYFIYGFFVAWINAKSRGFLSKVQYRESLQIMGGKFYLQFTLVALFPTNYYHYDSVHLQYYIFNSHPSMVIVKFHIHLLII